VPFAFRTFFRMFRLAFADHPSPRRRKVVWTLLFLIPALAAVNAVCFALDHLFYPGHRKLKARSPVFIIGHARSGTSLMHRLMSRDGERFSYFTMYEMFVPSLIQKKLIRFLGECDRRYWGETIARRIRAWEDRTFAKGRQMHPMSLSGPEEDEFLMAISCVSPVITTVFPYMREFASLYYFDELPAPHRRRVMRFYEACVRRQLFLNGSHKIHLSKNPVFSGKVRSLIETFPDARFVVLVRNPLETIPSLLKMCQRNWKASDCDRERIADSLEVLGGQSFHTYRHPFEVLAENPETPYAVVEYTDLVERPRKTVEAVYEKLGFEVSPAFGKTLAEEEALTRDHRAEHVYRLEEFGLTRAEIRVGLADLFERFGWEETF
jgi:hypothetical protein